MATNTINRIKTYPPGMPFDFDEIKEHIRVDHEIEDTVLTRYVLASIAYVENFTWRVLRPTTFTGYMDTWDDAEIHQTPISAISSVKYYDSDNNFQTLATSDYKVDIVKIPATIEFTNQPNLYDKPNAIEIEFIAGYASVYTIPEGLIAGLYLMIGHLYDNRNATMAVQMHTLPIGLTEILGQYNARTL